MEGKHKEGTQRVFVTVLQQNSTSLYNLNDRLTYIRTLKIKVIRNITRH